MVVESMGVCSKGQGGEAVLVREPAEQLQRRLPPKQACLLI